MNALLIAVQVLGGIALLIGLVALLDNSTRQTGADPR